jgi:hypothetical protein
VNSHVGTTVKHSRLNLSREDTDTAHRCQRAIAITIAFGRNLNDFDLATAVRIPNQIGNMMCLPQRQLTGSRGNPDDFAGWLTHGLLSVHNSGVPKVAETFGLVSFCVPKLCSSFATSSLGCQA